MLILKDAKPMLLANVTNFSGIWEEVEENKIPKKNREALQKLGGSGVISGSYYRSCTCGRAYGKYFRKIAERVLFQPAYHNEFNKMNQKENKKSTLGNILSKLYCYNQGSNNIVVSINNTAWYGSDPKYVIEIEYKFIKEELVMLEHEYAEFAEVFRGKDKYSWSLDCPITKEEFAKLEKIFEEGKKYKIEFSEVESALGDFMENGSRFYYSCYTEESTFCYDRKLGYKEY